MRTDGQRVHAQHVFVSEGGNRVVGKKRAGHAQTLGLWAVNRQQLDASPAGGQLGYRPGRSPADEEEGIQRAVFHLVAGLVGLDVFGLDVGLFHAIGRQDKARIHEGARAGLVHANPLAFEVCNAFDARAFFDDDMHGLGVQVGNQPQIGNVGLAGKNAGACLRPRGHVGLAKAGFHGAARNGVDVGQRAVGRLGRGDNLSGYRHGIGNHAANRVIGASRTASADAKELLGMGRACEGRGQCGGEGGCGHAGQQGT